MNFTLLGGPHIWTIIYFLTSIILMLNNQVAQMDSIERCIADAHPFIRNYRNYVVAALCSLGMLIGTMYTAKVEYFTNLKQEKKRSF